MVYRARLAAVRGDTASAVALLSEALRLGIDGYPWLHGTAHADLGGLAADSTYRRLVEVRD